MTRRKPTGFIAICQCRRITGALDYERTDRKEAGRIMGEWLSRGCTVEPKFSGTWTERISTCVCQSVETQEPNDA